MLHFKSSQLHFAIFTSKFATERLASSVTSSLLNFVRQTLPPEISLAQMNFRGTAVCKLNMVVSLMPSLSPAKATFNFDSNSSNYLYKLILKWKRSDHHSLPKSSAAVR
jgi:hypothetical protein